MWTSLFKELRDHPAFYTLCSSKETREGVKKDRRADLPVREEGAQLARVLISIENPMTGKIEAEEKDREEETKVELSRRKENRKSRSRVSSIKSRTFPAPI